MLIRTLILCLGTMVTFTVCQNKKSIPMDAPTPDIQEDFKVVLNRGGCYGKCPIYSLIIEADRKATFLGKRFTKKEGTHQRVLTDSTFYAVVDAFEAANLSQYDDEYPTQIADLPTIEIIYVHKGQRKWVKGGLERPEAVKDLQRLLEAIAESDGWTSLESKEGEGIEKDHVIDDEIIIQTRKKLILTKWLKQYDAFDVRIKNRVSPSMDYWLVSFNKHKIEPEKMLDLLRKDPDIVEAEFNKRVSWRKGR